MDLSLINGAAAAAGAPGRSPQGTGAGTPVEAASFLDALAALASLTATFDGERASSVDETPVAGEWLDQATDALDDGPASVVTTDRFEIALANLPVTFEPAPAAALPAADAAPPSDAASVTDAAASAALATASVPGVAVAPVVPAEPGALPAGPVRSAAPAGPDIPAATLPGAPAVPDAAAAPVVPDGSVDGKVAAESSASNGSARSEGAREKQALAEDQAPPAMARRTQTPAQATSSVLEHLRAVGRASGRTDAASDANVTPAAVARLVVPDAASSTPPPPVSVSTAAWLPGAAVSTQGQRSTSDSSGEQMAGFTFGGHAAPRAAAPVTAGPSVTPNFGALVNTMHASDAVPAETTTQIVQAIRMQMLRDGGEAHIRLDPRQFGDMTVRIRVEQGQVTARVEADAPVVREWLQSNQHVLRQSLAGQQLTLDRLEVHEPPASSQGRRDESSARDGAREEQRHQRRRRPETGELFEVVA